MNAIFVPGASEILKFHQKRDLEKLKLCGWDCCKVNLCFRAKSFFFSLREHEVLFKHMKNQLIDFFLRDWFFFRKKIVFSPCFFTGIFSLIISSFNLFSFLISLLLSFINVHALKILICSKICSSQFSQSIKLSLIESFFFFIL